MTVFWIVIGALVLWSAFEAGRWYQLGIYRGELRELLANAEERDRALADILEQIIEAGRGR